MGGKYRIVVVSISRLVCTLFFYGRLRVSESCGIREGSKSSPVHERVRTNDREGF